MATAFANSPLPSQTSTAKIPTIRTAGCLIIGDEILNGKTIDTNSAYFAKYCFELGIDLKRIEVIADNEDEIFEASRRMVANYDFVISSGGIGPTHDGTLELDKTIHSRAYVYQILPTSRWPRPSIRDLFIMRKPSGVWAN